MLRLLGAWLRPVERTVRVREVGRSNRPAPTKQKVEHTGTQPEVPVCSKVRFQPFRRRTLAECEHTVYPLGCKGAEVLWIR